MKKVLTFLLLLLASTSWAREPGCVVSGDTLTIFMKTSDLGEGIESVVSNWPSSFDRYIELANNGQGVMYVEAQSDSTGWRWVRQTLRGKPAGAGVNLRRVNQAQDAAGNQVRLQNGERFLMAHGLTRSSAVSKHSRFGNTVFIKIYPGSITLAPMVASVEAPGKPGKPYVVPNFEMTHLPKLGLSLHLGATSTWKNVAPMVALSLRYNKSVVMAYGFHSLFFPREQNALGEDRDVFDQGAGLLVGKQISRPLWLMVGYERQEMVLDDVSDQSGRNIFYFQGGELGLMWLGDNHIVTLTGLYGHKKVWSADWDQKLETDMGARLAVGIRFKGGK